VKRIPSLLGLAPAPKATLLSLSRGGAFFIA
jgi:hypothetical protein